MLQVRGWVLFMWGVILLRSPGGLAEKQVNGWSLCPCRDMHSFFFIHLQAIKTHPHSLTHTVFRGNPVSWGRGKFTASGGRERKTRELRRRWRRWWEKTESGGRWGVELWVMTYWLLQDAQSFHRLKPIGCEGPLCSVLRCRGQARSHLTFDLCYFLCVGAADHQAAQPDYIWAGVCAEQRKEGCVNGWCSHLTVTKEVPPTFGRFEAPLCDLQRSSWSLT